MLKMVCSVISGKKILKKSTQRELIKKMLANYWVFGITNIAKLLSSECSVVSDSLQPMDYSLPDSSVHEIF